MANKIQKDGNKIKKLKIRKGFPLFINFCYNQRIRNELKESKLFLENNELHYHIKHTTGGESIDRVDFSEQYVISSILNYYCDNSKIVINGNIKKYKNGNKQSEKIINNIVLYRIYTNEKELFSILDSLMNNK